MKDRYLAVLAVCLWMPLAAAGCGSDDEGGGAGGTSGKGGSGATGGAKGGGAGTSSGGNAGTSSGGNAGTSSGGSAGTASGGSAGGDKYAECKAAAATNQNPVCANCACDNCLDTLIACQEDPTCIALRDCAQANCPDCSELCTLTNCGDELAAAGGLTGPGTTKAIAVRDCTDQNQCNCCTQ